MKQHKFFLLLITIILCCIKATAQDYDALKNLMLSNFPKRFEEKEIHPKTYNLGLAIINQISEDFRTIGFDEKKARWFHVNDYFLYDVNTSKRIGNTCWLVYKSEDNKIIGTYMMNTENPVNNTYTIPHYIKKIYWNFFFFIFFFIFFPYP